LQDYDLVLSYTGGAALEQLRSRLGAVRVAPLYGSVDPQAHRPVPPVQAFRADLSYLGTYAADRQHALEELFVEPARRLPHRRFLIGGALYPQDFPWTSNIYFVRHVVPADHPAFFCSSPMTLNVTRKAMADMGYCPSGRLFEAASCGVAILSDRWEGLSDFFEPQEEILIARTSEEAIEAMTLSPERLVQIGQAARQRVLAEHTADCRACELERILESVPGSVGQSQS
jgi:spore maturation protein CgeB